MLIKSAHRLILASIAGLLVSIPACAEEPPVWVEPYIQPATGIAPSQLKQMKQGRRITPSIVSLDAPLPQLTHLRTKTGAYDGGAMQIGLHRALSQTENSGATGALLFWQPLEDLRQAAAISFRSAKAKGLRLGMRVEHIPLGTQFRFYPQNSDTVLEIPAHEIMTRIQDNLDAGEAGDEAYTYWTPDFGGAETTMEIILPPDATPGDLAIAIPGLAHFFTTPEEIDPSLQSMAGPAASCHNNTVCLEEARNPFKYTVARLIFISSGSAYYCTGNLLNDQANSGTPYLHTASHCISTQAEASSMESDWFFWSPYCKSNATPGAAAKLRGGAKLLQVTATADSSFMRLNSPAPAGALFAGWTTAAIGSGTLFTTAHHPQGDLQKISNGYITDFANCVDGANSSVTCSSANPNNANFYISSLTSGIVESGSSGSAIFVNGRYIVGHLKAGSTLGCSASGQFRAIYGRFDRAYSAGTLGRWLENGTSQSDERIPVFRFYNTLTGTHFYTSSAAERDSLIINTPHFTYEGSAFYAYSNAAASHNPVFRFFNTRTGVHFYTISEAERDSVIRNMPHFSYEGISWYAKTFPDSGTAPMFRFLKPAAGVHFYTINEAERDHLQRYAPDYNYEGIAYYAWTSS